MNGRRIDLDRTSAWPFALLLAAFFGGLVGWSARTITADHRYISSLAARNESVNLYYMDKYDEQIQQNKSNIQKEKHNAKY